MEDLNGVKQNLGAANLHDAGTGPTVLLQRAHRPVFLAGAPALILITRQIASSNSSICLRRLVQRWGSVRAHGGPVAGRRIHAGAIRSTKHHTGRQTLVVAGAELARRRERESVIPSSADEETREQYVRTDGDVQFLPVQYFGYGTLVIA